MKRSLFLLSFIFLLTCCEESQDYLIPASEVPGWLKERISHDEKIIESDPQSGLEISAWIRYMFKGQYFFEYRNGYSSLGPEKFNYNGAKIMINQEPYLNFERDKCCKEFVWKGPSYIDY